MAQGSFLSSQPSTVSVNGVGVHNVLRISDASATPVVDQVRVSDELYMRYGGRISLGYAYTLRFRAGKASADTSGADALFIGTNMGIELSTLVIVQGAKGLAAAAAQTLTTTIAKFFAANLRESDSGERDEFDVDIVPICTDGSTDPVSRVWS